MQTPAGKMTKQAQPIGKSIQADFKAEPWKQTVHNSKTIWISTCYDLIDGRWEGFVAMSFKKPVDA